MTNYRRNYVPGGTFFFTLITYHRRPILTTPLAREALVIFPSLRSSWWICARLGLSRSVVRRRVEQFWI